MLFGFYFCLLICFNFSYSVDDYDEWPNIQKHSLPRYWPPWEVYEKDQFTEEEWNSDDSIDPMVRNYLTWDFARASYTPNCNAKDERSRTLIPIYFWPSQTIELPCLMCAKSLISDGNPKMWRVRPAWFDGLLEEIFQSQTPQWETLSSFEYRIRDVPQTVLPGYSGEMNGNCSKYLDSGRKQCSTNFPVYPKFYQREGKLIIAHSSAAVQGAYNCYEEGFQGEVKQVMYFLIAMAPYYEATDPSDMPGQTYGWDPKHRRRAMFDIHYIWHMIPGYLQSKTTDTYDWWTTPDKDILSPEVYPYKVGLVWGQQWSEAKVKKLAGSYSIEKFIHDAINLDIILEWAQWTECTACLPYVGRKVREGHCYLRKRDINRPVGGPKALLEVSKERFEWLTRLNHILSVEPFLTKGIRLNSHILAQLIVDTGYKCKGYCKFPQELLTFFYVIFESYSGFIRDENGKFGKIVNICFEGNRVERTSSVTEIITVVAGYVYDAKVCSKIC